MFYFYLNINIQKKEFFLLSKKIFVNVKLQIYLILIKIYKILVCILKHKQRGNHEIFIHPSIGRHGFSCRLRF